MAKTSVFVQVEASMKRQLEKEARDRDVSVAHVIREAIRRYFKAEKAEVAA